MIYVSSLDSDAKLFREAEMYESTVFPQNLAAARFNFKALFYAVII